MLDIDAIQDGGADGTSSGSHAFDQHPFVGFGIVFFDGIQAGTAVRAA